MFMGGCVMNCRDCEDTNEPTQNILGLLHFSLRSCSVLTQKIVLRGNPREHRPSKQLLVCIENIPPLGKASERPKGHWTESTEG